MAKTERKDRDPKTGKFLKGNQCSRKHGVYSLAARAKVPSVRGARKLKYQSIMMTQRYTHTDEDRKRRAAKLLEREENEKTW